MSIHQAPPQSRAVKGNRKPIDAALEYAEQGIPVFPCKPDKSPYTHHGHKDATTDPHKIGAWWSRWPDAWIGTPTGKRSGWFVVDEDRSGALAELAQELPDTRTVATPSGVRHLYLRYVEGIRNSSGSLPDGVDVRGEGGYVIAPPSPGYKVINHSPVAEAPAWLLELIKAKPRVEVRGTAHATRPEASVDLDGPPIPFGRRNTTLTSIAGILHNGRQDFGELLVALEEINRYRCVPPIGEHPEDTEPDEVAKIARSIAGRKPSRPSEPPVEPQMLEELGCIELAHLWNREWRGQDWLSARSIFATLILAAREYGHLIPAGVRISLSYRALAELARVTLQTAYNSVQLLREAHLVRKDDYERPPEDAGAFVLVSPDEATRAKLEHSSTEGGIIPGLSVLTLRGPRLRGTTPGTGKRLRGTVPGTRKVRETPALRQRETILRYSKKTEYVLDVLDFHGGEMSLQDLVQVVGGRPRDLRSRVLEGLEKDRVLRLEGERVYLQEGWIECLYEVHEITGEEEIVERTRALHAKQREERWTEPPEEPEGQQEDGEEPDVIRSEGEVFEMSREFFRITESEGKKPGGSDLLRSKLAASPYLDSEDREALDAIAEFEERFGPGSFTFNRAGAKALFYQVEGGHWPEGEQLDRLRAYAEAAGGILSNPEPMKASA